MPVRTTPTELDRQALAAAIEARRAQLATLPVPKPRIRKGRKKHSNNRERSYADREKARRAKLKQERHHDWYREHCTKARAYWRGETDVHP